MTEHGQKVEKVCALWHMWFEDDTHDYSESKTLDIEYFVGVLMYNHFTF